jgi:IPT/TIG domain-containing protein
MARILLLSLIAAVALTARDPFATPMMRVAEPATAKVGDVVAVTGINLEKEVVAEVYLTDRTDDTKVTVLEQSSTTIKFKVPSVKPGNYWLKVLVKGDEPVFIEEPCRITVEP